jgi:aminopeptidase N
MPCDRRSSMALAAALLAASCADPPPPPAARPAPPAAPSAAPAPPPAPPLLRLPATARPLRYDLDLTIVPSRETFAGTVSIDLQIAEPTPVLWLNATELTLRDASLTSGARTLTARVVPGGEDFVGLAFDAPVGPGPARITVAYEGPLDKEKSRGLYRQAEGPGADDWYAYSFFEPIDARRAFPCFDEPGAKVPWKLTLHVKKDHVALSNAAVVSEADEPGGMKAVAFAETRPLPSYLVALVVGPFDVVGAGTAGRYGTPLRFVVPRGRGPETAYAAEATPRIVGLLEDWFGMQYPYGRLDVAVVPRYWGTMEHPGLLAMGQPLTLIRPADRSLQREQAYANITTHELSHYWFGDYVTMAWWDDTWLNEALATWMDTKLTDRFEPSWRLAARRRHDSAVMDADALATAKRIRQPIESKTDIDDAFDGAITYGKGSLVLAMFEGFLGAEVFQRGVRRFMKEHAWGSAVADDLLAALSAEAGRDVAPAFKTFLDQPGLPIVSAEPVCGGGPPRVHLTQRRFVPAGSAVAADALWQIPVCVKYGAGRVTSRACTLLTAKEADLPLPQGATTACPEWVMPNEGAMGYYRVAYRPEALRRLLTKAGDALTVAERASLLDDAAALTRTGALPIGDALALVPDLVQRGAADPLVVERSFALVQAARSAELPPALHARFARFVQTVYGKRGRALGWRTRPGEGADDQLMRREALGLLTGAGEDAALRAEAHDLVLRWLDDAGHDGASRPRAPGTLSPGLVDAALFAAGLGNDRALFDRLRRAAREAPSHEEKSRLLGALGGFPDPALAREAFSLLVGDELDPRDSMGIVFRAFASLETRDRAYDLFKESFDAMARRLRPDEASWLLGVLGVFCDEERRADAAAFFGPRAEKMEGAPRALANSLEAIGQCAAAAKMNRASLTAFLKKY